MRWQTRKIMSLLGDRNTIWSKCTTGGAYGDTVSTRVILFYDEDDDFEGEWIQVQGFSTADTVFDDPDDCEIEMIEVTDDSGHGLQSSNRNIARMYADAVAMLRQAGFVVVPDMKAHF